MLQIILWPLAEIFFREGVFYADTPFLFTILSLFHLSPNFYEFKRREEVCKNVIDYK